MFVAERKNNFIRITLFDNIFSVISAQKKIYHKHIRQLKQYLLLVLSKIPNILRKYSLFFYKIDIFSFKNTYFKKIYIKKNNLDYNINSKLNIFLPLLFTRNG